MRTKDSSDSHLQAIREVTLWEGISCGLRPLNPISQRSFQHASDKLEAFGR